MSEQKRLDRPELREKIIECLKEDWGEDDVFINKADQILALFPDIEQRVSQALEENTLSIIEEAKKQERKDVGLELQLALSKVINFEGFNEFKLSKFIIDSASKLCKGQALKEGK